MPQEFVLQVIVSIGDDALDMRQIGYARQRIAGDNHQIGQFARFDGAKLLVDPQRLGRPGSGRLEHLDRRQATGLI